MQTAKLAQGARRLPPPERLAVHAANRPNFDARADWRNIGILASVFMGLHLALLPFELALGGRTAELWEYALFGSTTTLGLFAICISWFVPSEIRVGGADLEVRFGKKEKRLRALRNWRAVKSHFGENWHFTLFLAGGGRLRLIFVPIHVARTLAADLAARATSPRLGSTADLDGDPGTTVTPSLRWPEPWAITLFSNGQKSADGAMREWERPNPPLEAMHWQTAPGYLGRRIGWMAAAAAMILPVAVCAASAWRLGLQPPQIATAAALGAGVTWVVVRTALRDHFTGAIGVSRFGFPRDTSNEQASRIVSAATADAGLGLVPAWANEFGREWKAGEAISLLLQDRKVERKIYLVLRTRGRSRVASHQRLKGAIQEAAFSLGETV